MSRTRLKRNGGFTLMEVVVSMAVLMFGFLMSMQILKDMSDDIYVEQVQSDINKRVTGRLYDMVGEMQGLVLSDAELVIAQDGVTVAAGAQGNSIAFRQVAGTDASGNIVYGGKIRYRWMISPEETAGNGIDEDQNGVADDGLIVREELDAVGVVTSTFPVEDFVPQTARVSRREDPYFGQTIAGFCVCRRASPNDRQITVTIQRSVNERMRTDNGTVATAAATRTLYVLNP